MSQGFDPFDPEEWGDKPGCSAFETALEMRGRGALATDAVSVLEVHLGACDACRDHAARLGRVDASLAAAVAVPDVGRLRGKMNDELRQIRRVPWILAAMGLVMVVSIEALFRTSGIPMMRLKVFTLVTFGVGLASSSLVMYLRARRLRRFLAESDVIDAYRRWLRSGIKAARRVPWAMLLNALILVLYLPDNLRRYAAGRPRAGLFLSISIFAVACIVFLLVTTWRNVRRMKAELAELH